MAAGGLAGMADHETELAYDAVPADLKQAFKSGTPLLLPDGQG